MEVRLLTLIEKEAIEGKQYDLSSYFNPIQDCNNEWIITQQEVDNCVNQDYMWVKELPIIEYCPKPTPPIDEI